MKIKKYILFFVLYFSFCAIVSWLFVCPVLFGDVVDGTYVQLYFDSQTYHAFFENGVVNNIFDLFDLRSNYAGPFFVIWCLRSPVLIFIFNIFLFVSAFLVIKRGYNVKCMPFLFLLFLNPVVFVSVLSVNKEVFSVLVIALLLVYAKGQKRKLYGPLALFLAFFVRWQLVLFVALYIVIVSKINIFRKKRLLCVVILIIALSFVAPGLNAQFGVFSDILSSIEASEYSGGLFSSFLSIEAIPGGYLLTVIPKSLLILFGVLLKNYDKIFDFSDFINNFVVYIYSFFMLLVFLGVMAKRRLKSENPAVFLFFLYVVFFGLSPIYAPRYFLPVYVILLVILLDNHFGVPIKSFLPPPKY